MDIACSLRVWKNGLDGYFSRSPSADKGLFKTVLRAVKAAPVGWVCERLTVGRVRLECLDIGVSLDTPYEDVPLPASGFGQTAISPGPSS